MPLPWILIALAGLASSLLVNAAAGDELSLSRRLQSAEALIAADQFDAAAIELADLLRLAPRSSRARLLLGRARLARGQAAEAVKELRRAREYGASAQSFAADLGTALLMQGEYRALLRELTVQPAWPPGLRAEIHARRGRAWLALGQPDRARQAFKRALALRPAHGDALSGMAQLAVARGDRQEARLLLEKALAARPRAAPLWMRLGDLEWRAGRDSAAAQAWSKALELGGDSASLHLRRARARIELEDFDAAWSDLEAAARGLPKDHSGLVFATGLLRFRQGDYRGADRDLGAVYAANPELPALGLLRGAVRLQLSDPQGALAPLQQAALGRPRSLQAARLLVLAHLQLADLEAARPWVERVLTQHPDDAAVMQAWGEALLAARRVEEAQPYLQRAAALSRSARRLDKALADLTLGGEPRSLALAELAELAERHPRIKPARLLLVRERLRDGDFAAARRAAEALWSQWPDDPQAAILTGRARLAVREEDAAEQAFRQALELTPGHPEAIAGLAALARGRGDLQAARGWYEQLLAHRPGHLAARLGLAELALVAGERKTALEHLRRAVREHPSAPAPRLELAAQRLLDGQGGEVLELLAPLARSHADDPQWLALAIRARLLEGRVQEADAGARRLAALQPDAAQSHYLQAAVHAQAGRRSALEASLHRAVGLDAEDPMAVMLMTHLVLQAPDAAAAQRSLARLQEMLPGHPALLDLAGQRALRDGRAADAVAVYRRARRRWPDKNSWVMRLARAQVAAGQPGAAAATLDAWLRAHPQDAAMHYLAADLARGRADEQRARQGFERVLELAPEHLPALTRLALLLREVSQRQPSRLEPRFHLARALASLGEGERAQALLQDLLRNGSLAAADRARVEAALRDTAGRR